MKGKAKLTKFQKMEMESDETEDKGEVAMEGPKFTKAQLDKVEWALGGMDDPDVYGDLFPVETVEEGVQKAKNPVRFLTNLIWALEVQFVEMCEENYAVDGVSVYAQARSAKAAAEKIREWALTQWSEFDDEVDSEVDYEVDYFEYLDDLRESGVTNMFGARQYLQNAFGLGKKEAGEILQDWMESFTDNN